MEMENKSNASSGGKGGGEVLNGSNESEHPELMVFLRHLIQRLHS